MTNYLCLSITFLDPLFHGKGDYEQSEWPPSPMRLFQALLAGSRTGCRERKWSEIKADAFRWLESLDPPEIIAPRGREGSAYRLFVPNNDLDKVAAYWRQHKEPPENKQLAAFKSSKDVRSQLLLDGDTLHYLWSIESDDGVGGFPHADVICRQANHLLALGWGIDQVVGAGKIIGEADAVALRGQRWQPWVGHRTGMRRLRVPICGSLDDLEKVHQTFIKRLADGIYHPPIKPNKFETYDYIPKTMFPPRPYAAFELPEGVAFRQVDVAKVAAMLRSLTIRCAKGDTQKFPGGSETYVAGHAGTENQTPPRFSYLPLPTIGHENADGMIRRLLVAEPIGGSGVYRCWAENRLRNSVLRDEDGNEWGALLDPWRPASEAIIRRYVDSASTWCTVTPVVLPGFDDGKLIKAERLFFKALRQAGIPVDAIADLTLRKAPFWPGSHTPRLYYRPKYLTDRASWHVRIRFQEPVAGPIAIGAGRHCGLGIFSAGMG